jgi:hypothetical protein
MLDLEESLSILDTTDVGELHGFAAEAQANLNTRIIGVFEDLVGVELEDEDCVLVHAEIAMVRAEDLELERSQVARLLGLFVAFQTEILGTCLLETDFAELLEAGREQIQEGTRMLADTETPEKTESCPKS